ncbi:molybdopterin molybdotransferase MoeA [Corynebacterium uropygiale]|uniref:Molybdopterin molybdenumtransferase n=1 Tax=Corynebacterium uropygiale TaxID=1775911 RepID=A0A9X1QRF4_9CORY|nr:molybdopterin molybdotransferase MoeA [Corynebacterium uropygiale]MCF4005655.1 molybdopterin molybdotransferase MoeA [Corynebacterium uropygiale]
MRTPEAHREAVRAHLARRQRPADTEVIPVERAEGRVLARDLVALADSPRFDNSQMDGVALPEEALDHAGTWPCGPMIPAGTDPDPLYPDGLHGRLAPIMTGARIPRGTAAIVPIEHCDPPSFDAPELRVPDTPAGQFIRRRGSDCHAQQVLLPAGLVLTPIAVGVAASQEITEVEVRRPPRLLLCTGGEEVRPAGSPVRTYEPSAATIPDANAPLMAAMARRAGIDVVGHVRTGDDPDAWAAALSAELRRCAAAGTPADVIVTSGGISHGAFEVVRQVLGSHPDAWFGHVAQQPGGPQGISEFEGVPVVALPGNPISTLVSFHLFVLPALAPEHCPSPRLLPLRGHAHGMEGKDQFRRGRICLDAHGADCAVEILGGPGSHLVAAAAAATCLVRIPAGQECAGGELVRVYPLL